MTAAVQVFLETRLLGLVSFILGGLTLAFSGVTRECVRCTRE
jgi:hypothetical protein